MQEKKQKRVIEGLYFPYQYKDETKRISSDTVDEILNNLPPELFKDPNVKFLDPTCYTGIFLSRIADRLIEGLKPVFPDFNKRLQHIYTNQLYGIAISALIVDVVRDTVYGTRSGFKGNIYYDQNIRHNWKDNKCSICKTYLLDQYENRHESFAYNFLHKNLKEMWNTRFDVIIGNPPCDTEDRAHIPVYHLFVRQAIKYNPRYLAMVIPYSCRCDDSQLDSELNTFNIAMPDDKRITRTVEIDSDRYYFIWDRDKLKIKDNNNG